MSSVKVSIIVPVYNTGNYLRKCVDSILGQTLKDIEVLIIDDGSTDESGKICDFYSEQDSRVKVIHKKNEGVSVARNLGIALANGVYIGFVDSDDWIDPEMYECLVGQAELHDADLVMSDVVTVYADGRRELDTISQLLHDMILTKKDLKPTTLIEMAGSTCRCIYSSKLINTYDIHFPPAVKFSEDRIFNIYSMGYANKIVYTKKTYYHRLVHSKSAVHSFHKDYLERITKAHNYIRNAIQEAWGDKEQYHKVYYGQLVMGAIATISNYYYKNSTLTHFERFKMVEAICNEQQIREAIVKSGMGGIRGKWILNRKVFLLCLCAKMANIKHGR